MLSFTTANKKITVFPSAEPNRPIIYLNTFGEEAEQVLQVLRDGAGSDFTLAAISSLDWNRDMVPWDIPPISANSAPCIGGADHYLRLLLESILPKAEEAVRGTPPWRGLAGYSLAGLFAVYAIYQTDVFSRIASVSGSLWFPGIREYIFSRQPVRWPDHMYFSLGDREHRTRNSSMKCVRSNTEEIASFYKEQGIDTVFRLNPGNHFKNAAERSAAGIGWMLSR